MPALAPTSVPKNREPLATDRAPAGSVVRACDALAALKDEPLAARAPSALFTILLAVLTLGAGPAVLWSVRFQRAAKRERAMLQCLTAWARSHLRHRKSHQELDSAVRRVNPSLVAGGFSILFAVAAIAVAASVFFLVPPQSEPLRHIIGSTYGFNWARFANDDFSTVHVRVFAGWTATLFTAYLLHLAQVHLFARRVQGYLDQFNRLIAVEEGFAPVLREPIGWIRSPVWAVASALLLAVSGWWSIPMAVAGATDARYRCRASCRMRDDLADRVKSLIHLRPTYHDAETVPVTPKPMVRCATEGCDVALPAGARFCPRCGARRGKAVDRRA